LVVAPREMGDVMGRGWLRLWLSPLCVVLWGVARGLVAG
jgi:hypothetical protein